MLLVVMGGSALSDGEDTGSALSCRGRLAALSCRGRLAAFSGWWDVGCTQLSGEAGSVDGGMLAALSCRGRLALWMVGRWSALGCQGRLACEEGVR